MLSGRPNETFSLKLTTNIWSCGLLERAKARAAAITSGRFGPHASAVIDNQSDRDRDIFVAEIFDLLRHSVLINLEIVFAESGNQSAFVVLRGCVQNHHVHIYADGVVVARDGEVRCSPSRRAVERSGRGERSSAEPEHIAAVWTVPKRSFGRSRSSLRDADR